jgi:hypothetical protein
LPQNKKIDIDIGFVFLQEKQIYQLPLTLLFSLAPCLNFRKSKKTIENNTKA